MAEFIILKYVYSILILNAFLVRNQSD
jgi:hypothetical protein